MKSSCRDFDIEFVGDESAPTSSYYVSKPVLTNYEKGFASTLAHWMTFSIAGEVIKPVKDTLSPLGLTVLDKIHFNDHRPRVRISARGSKDVTLENLSVVTNSIRCLSGSGTRLATEWWEKKNGYELITFTIDEHIFCLHFNGEWQMDKCSVFLYEGAELCDNTVYVREEVEKEFQVYGEKYRVEHVQKYNFAAPIPDNIEGIILYVDHQMWRLKEEHTYDLQVREKGLYTRDGTCLFENNTSLPDATIVEVDSRGRALRTRPDKSFPDSDYKVKLLKALPTLAKLREMLAHLPLECAPYVPTQWVGFDILSSIEGEPKCVSENLFCQLLTADMHTLIDPAYTDRARIITYGAPLLKSVSLIDFVNDKYQRFNFPKFIKALRRGGYSYNLERVRRFLIDHGIFPQYEHFLVSSSFFDGVYKNSDLIITHQYLRPSWTAKIKHNLLTPHYASLDNMEVGYYYTSKNTIVQNIFSIHREYLAGNEGHSDIDIIKDFFDEILFLPTHEWMNRALLIEGINNIMLDNPILDIDTGTPGIEHWINDLRLTDSLAECGIVVPWPISKKLLELARYWGLLKPMSGPHMTEGTYCLDIFPLVRAPGYQGYVLYIQNKYYINVDEYRKNGGRAAYDHTEEGIERWVLLA